jgi:hypothetical protein
VNIIAPERRELFSNIMLRLGAAGHETAPFTMPRALGYRVAGGERLLVTAMLHNPTEVDYRGVRLRVMMPYIPAGTWRRPMGVMPFYLDVMPPAGIHAYDLPAGYSEMSWEGRPALSGRVLGMGGHVHKHAIALRLEDVTEGRVLWERKPVYDSAGEVKAMPTSMFPFGLRLRADHVYRLKAIYQNPTGAMIPDGGMGALGGIFVPDGALPWPAADPANPEYQLDVKTVREGLAGRTKPDGHQH